VFWRVTLPLARRSIFAAGVLAFARSLGDFGATLMVAGNIPHQTQTAAVAIYDAVESGNTLLARVLVLVISVVAILIVYVANRLEHMGLGRLVAIAALPAAGIGGFFGGGVQAAVGVTVLFGPRRQQDVHPDSIAGFVKPDAGRILLDDEILFDGASGVNLPPRRRNCGYVFQNYALFPHMTLRANLMFAADRLPRLERHRRVSEILERFHLKDVSGRRPHEVSGGEQQRCSIARALIGAPKLLLLDEPARGLDAPLREELYQVLRQVRSEFSLPGVTHDLTSASRWRRDAGVAGGPDRAAGCRGRY
jgi:ABC-type lipoprotein export system ATPase subunit